MKKEEVVHLTKAFVDRFSIGLIAVGAGPLAIPLIEALGERGANIEGLMVLTDRQDVRAAARRSHLPLVELSAGHSPDVTVCAATEVTPHRHFITDKTELLRAKAAITEARTVVCLSTADRVRAVLSKESVPAAVVPSVRSLLARHVVGQGGVPELPDRELTGDGYQIMELRNLSLVDAVTVETELKLVPGVVEVGLSARRPCDLVLVANGDEVSELT